MSYPVKIQLGEREYEFNVYLSRNQYNDVADTSRTDYEQIIEELLVSEFRANFPTMNVTEHDLVENKNNVRSYLYALSRILFDSKVYMSAEDLVIAIRENKQSSILDEAVKSARNQSFNISKQLMNEYAETKRNEIQMKREIQEEEDKKEKGNNRRDFVYWLLGIVVTLFSATAIWTSMWD